MADQLVEALVVEHRHQLCIGRLAVGSHDGERPLLLLSRCEPVAEGVPRQFQLLVGQWPPYGGLMGVAAVLLHPCEGEQDTVAPLLLVFQFAVDKLVAPVHSTLLDALLSGEDAVDDMYVGG